MSTKGHFIYEDGIEGYEETSERKAIFGKFRGFNCYLILENKVLKSFQMLNDFLIIETKNTDKLPKKFKIWGDAILNFEYNLDYLIIGLEGGHHITSQIIKNDYSKMII